MDTFKSSKVNTHNKPFTITKIYLQYHQFLFCHIVWKCACTYVLYLVVLNHCLPTMNISPCWDNVLNEGRSAETSHLYVPPVLNVIFLRVTRFKSDAFGIVYEVQENNVCINMYIQRDEIPQHPTSNLMFKVTMGTKYIVISGTMRTYKRNGIPCKHKSGRFTQQSIPKLFFVSV